MRVLVTNEKPAELEALAQAVEALGEDVVARELSVDAVAGSVRGELPELALVGLPSGENAEHALAMIGELVHEGTCPVVAITDNDDPDFVAAAVELGIYAHTSRVDPRMLRTAIDVAMHRFREHADLKLLLERRTLVERAKGIVMERYGIDEREAFDMLRRYARNSNVRLVVAAEHVLQGYRALPKKL